ncbi:MAG: hypothetical protein OJJ54_00380 [Pseudonocardia sp.]|nr:hypothetical protein [Pseudonocardia sp.]
MATRTDQATTVVGTEAAGPAYLQLRALATPAAGANGHRLRKALDAVQDLPDASSWAASAVDELVFGTHQQQWRRAMSQLALVDHAVRYAGRAGSADVRVARVVDFCAAAASFERFAGYLGEGGERRRGPFKPAEQAAVDRIGGAVLVDGSRPRTAAAASAAADHLRFLGYAAQIDAAFRPLGVTLQIGDDRAALAARLTDLQDAGAAVVEVLAARAAVLENRTSSPVPPQRSE